MAGFFRDLATYALAPRGTMHPVSAAPYSARGESALPDADLWPGAAAQSTHTGAAPQRAHCSPTPVPDYLAPARDDADDVRVPDHEPESPSVRAGMTELRVSREPAPEPRVTGVETTSDAAREAPASAPAAPTPRAPHISTPLRPATIAARAALAPAALRVKSRTDTDMQSAPEVHIHIGRIELTAAPAHEKKPRASTTRKALSLDEYLQQRSRR